jgi:hypothetical protein
MGFVTDLFRHWTRGQSDTKSLSETDFVPEPWPGSLLLQPAWNSPSPLRQPEADLLCEGWGGRPGCGHLSKAQGAEL